MDGSKESYREYLKSDHWKNLKAKKTRLSLARGSKKCAFCGDTKYLELHHVVYRNWLDVTTKDLRWLCHFCHEIAHKVLKNNKIKLLSRVKKGHTEADMVQRLHCRIKRLVLIERKRIHKKLARGGSPQHAS